MVTSTGRVATFAGTGARGAANGRCLHATFTNPTALATDIAGNLFVADGNTIRKITRACRVFTLRLNLDNPHAMAIGGTRTSGQTLFISDDLGLIALSFSNGHGVRYLLKYEAGKTYDAYEERYLERLQPLGFPFALAALDSTAVLYTDSRSDVVHYLIVEMDVGWVVARNQAVFRKATAMAVAPSGKIAIAGGDGEIAWLKGLELRKPLYPAQGLFPPEVTADARDFSIAYVGNSNVWWDTSWGDSIEGQMESALNARRPARKPPVRVLPIMMPGASLDAGEQYIETLAEASLVHEVLFVVDPEAIAASVKIVPYYTIAQHRKLWESRTVAHIVHLKKQLDHYHLPLLVMLQPAAFEFYGKPADAMRPLGADLRIAGVRTADLFPIFLQSAQRSELFGTPDAHMTSLGRHVVADSVLRYLTGRGLPARTRARN
ncbi:MAG TPA: hypothetical protein VMS32_08825 [Verrucomicrobiae bacterium]|nr:hypothetical protein [Verrucomicrobiae bacterium]